MIVKTLQNMLDDVRSLTDTENDQNATDAQLTVWINQGVRKLWALISHLCRDEYTKSLMFTIPSGNTYTIVAADFLEVRGVDISPDGGASYTKIKPWRFSARSRTGAISYRVLGKVVTVLPTNLATQYPYQLWYVTLPTAYVVVGDSIDFPLAGDEYVSLDVAAKLRGAKREEDPTTLLTLQAAALATCKSHLVSHNQGDQEAAADVSDDEDAAFW